MTLDADVIGIYESLIDERGYSWDNTVVGAFSGVSRPVMNIWIKDEITLRGIKTVINGDYRIRCMMSV